MCKAVIGRIDRDQSGRCGGVETRSGFNSGASKMGLQAYLAAAAVVLAMGSFAVTLAAVKWYTDKK
jgi:hypothetical protein